MTRKEERTKAAVDSFHSPNNTGFGYIAGFEDGAEWADEHSIEVKEVDLEKEIELIKGDYEQVDVAWNNDFDYIARHFFDLGLKAQKGE